MIVKDYVIPTEEQLSVVEEKMVLLYPQVAPDERFWTREGQLCDGWTEHILEAAYEATRLDSKPGLPWVAMGCTSIRDVLERYGELLRLAVEARIRLRIDTRDRCSSTQAVKRRLRDVVRLFVKNEPHSMRKLSVGRFRLIMNSSLTDIVIDRIALDRVRLAEVAQWAEIPSKAGIGFDDEHQKEFHHRSFPHGFKDYVGTDVQAWDWNVKSWQFDLSARVTVRQYGVLPVSDLGRLIRTSAWLTTTKVFALPDGRLIAQDVDGIQESGSLPTIMYNSKGRVGLGLLAGALDVKANGDDAVEKWKDGVVDYDAYKRYGFTVEAPELPQGVLFEFCSHWWSLKGDMLVAVPCNWGRTFYRLLGHPPSAEHLTQFLYEMRHSPDLTRCLEFLRASGWGEVVASTLGEA